MLIRKGPIILGSFRPCLLYKCGFEAVHKWRQQFSKPPPSYHQAFNCCGSSTYYRHKIIDNFLTSYRDVIYGRSLSLSTPVMKDQIKLRDKEKCRDVIKRNGYTTVQIKEKNDTDKTFFIFRKMFQKSLNRLFDPSWQVVVNTNLTVWLFWHPTCQFHQHFKTIFFHQFSWAEKVWSQASSTKKAAHITFV